MRLVLLLGFILPLTLASGRPLHAQELHAQDKTARETLSKPLKLEPLRSTLDDALIDLSKAADVNVIADATQFPAPQQGMQDTPWERLGQQNDLFLHVL
ncbi:hypothetical protein EON80_31050, partial [bacterium]